MIFLRELLRSYLGNVNVVMSFASRGMGIHEATIKRHVNGPITEEFFVLIYDCQNDSQVKSKALSMRDSLGSAGYERILGLRDYYPFTLGDAAMVKDLYLNSIPDQGIPIAIVLSMMETEAWFIHAHEHFPLVHLNFDYDSVQAKLGYDLRSRQSFDLPCPHEYMEDLYALFSRKYDKSEAVVQEIVDNIDFANLLLEHLESAPSLAQLVREIEGMRIGR